MKNTENISRGKRIAALAIIFIFIAMAAAATLFGVFYAKQEAFVSEPDINHNDSLLVAESGGNKMKLSVAKALASTDASAGVTVTANVLPETTENKTVLWSADWKNKNSAWANGKSVSDYLTLSAETTKSGESITLSCLKDFGEQIVITATAESNSSVTAACTADYCQKIKALNYTFKYGGNAMSSPSADADGVYRVDYTGEEKSYTVECTPVYTNYTVADTFSRNISGDFTYAFGYDMRDPFATISMQAGLFNGTVPEADLTEEAQKFVNLVTQASKTGNFNGCASMASSAHSMYESLSEQEQAHSRVVNAKQALDYLRTGLSDQRVDTEDLEGAQAILNGYTPPVSTGDFNGGVTFASEGALLNAAKACNDSGVGIMEFSITYTGTYSAAAFTFELGFTASSVSAARSMSITQSSVLF